MGFPETAHWADDPYRALGFVFAHYNLWLALFAGVTAVALWLLARFAPWLIGALGERVSEPQTKFVALVLLLLGGLASVAGSEAVLPAYLVCMVLAPTFLKNRDLPNRMRVVAFTILTPFYFLKAGSLVETHSVVASAGLITAFLAINTKAEEH
jgi:Kef-type K+ transport system membrane component KefB